MQGLEAGGAEIFLSLETDIEPPIFLDRRYAEPAFFIKPDGEISDLVDHQVVLPSAKILLDTQRKFFENFLDNLESILGNLYDILLVRRDLRDLARLQVHQSLVLDSHV